MTIYCRLPSLLICAMGHDEAEAALSPQMPLHYAYSAAHINATSHTSPPPSPYYTTSTATRHEYRREQSGEAGRKYLLAGDEHLASAGRETPGVIAMPAFWRLFSASCA